MGRNVFSNIPSGPCVYGRFTRARHPPSASRPSQKPRPKHQKAKIKNLVWSLEFQEYNVKEKKRKKEKKSHKNYIKKNIGTKLITNTKKLKLKIKSRVIEYGISKIQC